ncbi:MAG: glutamyl-tRNA reductase [Myxococcales bacterium]|nr:glutamyl-tRNA reductase [Myxococcales bacterium]
MELCCVGLSFRTAPLAVRERYAVARDELPALLTEIRHRTEVAEIFVLSTCNRTEIYFVSRLSIHGDRVIGAVKSAAVQSRGLPLDLFEQHAYVYRGPDALRHLFRVAASLDSMVVGEPQILGQVKDAWTATTTVGTAGLVLNRVMDHAFHLAKRIRTETQVAAGAVSVGWAAVEFARQVFADLRKCVVVVLGAGEMAEAVAVNLKDNGCARVVIANRSIERAEKLAAAHGWDATSMEELDSLLDKADILIASTGSPTCVLNVQRTKKALVRRHYRPLFVVDIAVPRDVEVGVGELDGVYLYNVDDLEQATLRNRAERAQEAEIAEQMVIAEVRAVHQWLAERTVVPTIKALQQKAHQICQAELGRSQRLLRELTDEQRVAVERITEGVVAKLLHNPIKKLKDESRSGDGSPCANMVRELFDLADISVVDGRNSDDLARDSTDIPSAENERLS